MEEEVNGDARRTSAALWFFGAAALYFLTAGWNLSGQSISNPEESRYACAARTMLRDHDWIVPKFNGEVRLVKPILFYWLIAATGKIGTAVGLALVTAMRLGPLCMGLMTVAAIFLLARKLFDQSARAAFVAVVVLMTCSEFHKLSREIVIEMTLTACLTWAWYFAWISLERIAQNAAKFLPLLGFYVCLGLACMAKGPLPVAGFVVLPFVVYLILSKQLKALRSAGLWWGIPITLLLGFWWFYALAQRGHREGVDAFFLHENLDRVLGEKDHIHRIPWLQYLIWWPEGLLPWILAVPGILWWLVSKRKPGVAWLGTDRAKFVFSALVVAFLIIGLSASKRTLYLLPLYPPFALWIGLVFHDIFETDSVADSVASTPTSRVKYVYGALAAAVVLALVYEIVIVPKSEKSLGNAAFFESVGGELKGRKLVTLNESANEAVWYLDMQTPIIKLSNPMLKDKFFNVNGTVLLLKDKDLVKTPQLRSALRIDPGFKARRGKDTYFLATPEPGATPDEAIFERRGKDSKDSGKDTGDD